MRSTHAIIDLNAIVANAKLLKERAKKDMVCIIKADAYGHGVLPVYKRFLKEGFHFFGVATFEEAMELRNASKDSDILVIGDTPVEDFKAAAENNICVAIHEIHGLKAALEIPNLRCHLKIDSGMHRIGFQLKDLEHIGNDVLKLKPEGIFTHIARADEVDKAAAMKQVNTFKECVDFFTSKGHTFRWIHFENSASILEIDPAYSNLVRGGICIYGLNPSGEVTEKDLKPALSLYTKIVDVREIEVGEGVSYSHIFRATRPTKVATLPIGYADGYKRQMSTKAEVYAGGKRLPVIGRITMDQIMIDITDTDLKVGDEVELIGPHVTCDELAKWADTINYEIVTNLSKRVRREYIGE
ncbi:alanine racemase [Guggenheimella bovis]